MTRKFTSETGDPSFQNWRYFAFAASDLSYSLIYFWIVSFLTIFYTDVFKISTVTVSVMMLITRVYDAINDPIIGGLLDNGRWKMGRYRPWIIIGGLAMIATAIFLFWAHPDWNNTGKIVYMYVTYILCTTAMTVFYMAYGALGGTISSNSIVRLRANSLRFAFSGAGNLAIGYFVPVLFAAFAVNSLVHGYLYGIIISGIIAVPFILITGFGTKEVVYPPKDVKPPLKEQFKVLLKNKPMLILTILFFLQGGSITLRMTSATYYFTYVSGNLSYFSLYSVLQSILSIVGALTSIYIFKIVKDKAKSLAIVLVITSFLMIGMYFFPAPGAVFFILAALSGYSNGATPALSYSMLPDAVDYTQDKDGLRTDAFMAAVGSFAFKCGTALAGAMVGIVLNEIGYVANAEQTAETLTGISNMMTIIPAVLIAVMAVLMFVYPLNENRHNKILTSLREKKLL